MEIIRLYNDVLMSVLLCFHNCQHYYTPTFVYNTTSETYTDKAIPLERGLASPSLGTKSTRDAQRSLIAPGYQAPGCQMNGAIAGSMLPAPMSPRRGIPSDHYLRPGSLRSGHCLAAR